MTRYAVVSLALLAVLAPPAFGDGGPVAGSDAGPSGVPVRGHPSRYVALPTPEGTLVARIERRGGRVTDSRTLPGSLVVTAVAYDGSATGLSADGRTLVLASPRFAVARRTSTFTILDTETLRRHGTIRLRGDFTLDAISPDGSMLYLIEATSKSDIEHEQPMLLVDPASFAVRERAPAPKEDGGSSGWLIIAAGLALLALVSFAAARFRAAGSSVRGGASELRL